MLIEDGRAHIPKSVLLPYALFEKVRSKIEDEIYLSVNMKALGAESYQDFLEIETMAEEL
jgi:hypothetical protein